MNINYKCTDKVIAQSVIAAVMNEEINNFKVKKLSTEWQVHVFVTSVQHDRIMTFSIGATWEEL